MMQLPHETVLRRGTVALVTGPSGSGKSTLIPLLSSRSDVALEPEQPIARTQTPLIELVHTDPAQAVRMLTAVGLGDPWTWCRTATELSVGQLARLRLLVALHGDTPGVVVDEWLASLDRVTARAVAWTTGRLLRERNRSAVLVTAHDDLQDDLAPSLTFRVGWGPEPSITAPTATAPYCSVLDELAYRRGDARDWHELRDLHYAAGDPATVHSYHVLEHPDLDAPAAVALLSYPDLHSAARNLATADAYRIAGDRRAAQRLNREVRKLSRIVVTPELRGCGIARRLIEHIVAGTDARWLECVTAMGLYSRFLERCGFREVPQGTAEIEAELMDWAARVGVPVHVALKPSDLEAWLETQSVRVAREGRRLIWLHYHHFVLHRRTRCKPPARIPGPSDPGWPEAYDVAARRMWERPTYWILGPIDPMTGGIDDDVDQDSRAPVQVP